MLSLFPRGVLDEILNLIESVSEDFPSYSSVSDFQFLSAGVPQGSFLGPLFFLIYVNDIADNLLSITRLFADDTSIASSSSNLMDIAGILNHDLRCIILWAKQ